MYSGGIEGGSARAELKAGLDVAAATPEPHALACAAMPESGDIYDNLAPRSPGASPYWTESRRDGNL